MEKTNKELVHLKFLNKENSINENIINNSFLSLPKNKLSNIKYSFISDSTIKMIEAIQKGLTIENAYKIRNDFIIKADALNNDEDIENLHKEMIKTFILELKNVKKPISSKIIIQCINYINYHLNTNLTINKLAGYVNANPSHLSVLFKKETGETIKEYIRKTKIEIAKNMLVLSSYSINEISEFLSFSSYSHFSKLFYYDTKMTPKEYQKVYLAKNKL